MSASVADEDLWRRRFHLFMLVRLVGLATFFLGVAIIYTDLLREGGWPAVEYWRPEVPAPADR